MPHERNSAHWMPVFRKICENFYSKQLNKTCISIWKENFDRIRAYCDDRVEAIRREMYPSHIGKEECLLDRHKIVAVHIQGFLKNPVFVKKDTANDENVIDLLANEYCCLFVLQTIINSWDGNNGKQLSIPSEYRDCLLKLFYKYRKSSLPEVRDTTFDYALSNIVYFVEKCFLR